MKNNTKILLGLVIILAVYIVCQNTGVIEHVESNTNPPVLPDGFYKIKSNDKYLSAPDIETDLIPKMKDTSDRNIWYIKKITNHSNYHIINIDWFQTVNKGTMQIPGHFTVWHESEPAGNHTPYLTAGVEFNHYNRDDWMILKENNKYALRNGNNFKNSRPGFLSLKPDNTFNHPPTQTEPLYIWDFEPVDKYSIPNEKLDKIQKYIRKDIGFGGFKQNSGTLSTNILLGRDIKSTIRIVDNEVKVCDRRNDNRDIHCDNNDVITGVRSGKYRSGRNTHDYSFQGVKIKSAFTNDSEKYHYIIDKDVPKKEKCDSDEVITGMGLTDNKTYSYYCARPVIKNADGDEILYLEKDLNSVEYASDNGIRCGTDSVNKFVKCHKDDDQHTKQTILTFNAGDDEYDVAWKRVTFSDSNHFRRFPDKYYNCPKKGQFFTGFEGQPPSGIECTTYVEKGPVVDMYNEILKQKKIYEYNCMSNSSSEECQKALNYLKKICNGQKLTEQENGGKKDVVPRDIKSKMSDMTGLTDGLCMLHINRDEQCKKYGLEDDCKISELRSLARFCDKFPSISDERCNKTFIDAKKQECRSYNLYDESTDSYDLCMEETIDIESRGKGDEVSREILNNLKNTQENTDERDRLFDRLMNQLQQPAPQLPAQPSSGGSDNTTLIIVLSVIGGLFVLILFGALAMRSRRQQTYDMMGGSDKNKMVYSLIIIILFLMVFLYTEVKQLKVERFEQSHMSKFVNGTFKNYIIKKVKNKNFISTKLITDMFKEIYNKKDTSKQFTEDLMNDKNIKMMLNQHRKIYEPKKSQQKINYEFIMELLLLLKESSEMRSNMIHFIKDI